MAFKMENFGAEIANAKGTLGGLCYYRYFNEENNDLTASGYFPPNLGLEVGDRIRVIPSVKTDPDEIYIVTSTANRTVVVKQVDTDGAVDSVNGKTGTVVLDASDVGALPNSTVIPEAIQVSTMPTASATEEGKIYQFTGTTDANYINGYFYKCVSDGQNPATYSWTQVSVQPTPSGLPDQTGQNGKFLTTDGTDASWSDKPLVNYAAGGYGVRVPDGPYIENYITFTGYNNYIFGLRNYNGATRSTLGGSNIVMIGGQVQAGTDTSNSDWTVINGSSAIGSLNGIPGQFSLSVYGVASGERSVQIGLGKNTDANTFKVSNTNGNFEIMSADGTIPAARHAALPAADGTYVLKLVIASGVPTLSWVAE